MSTSPSILDDLFLAFNIKSASPSTSHLCYSRRRLPTSEQLHSHHVYWECQKWGVQRRGVDQPWHSQISTTQHTPRILKVGRAGRGCRPAQVFPANSFQRRIDKENDKLQKTRKREKQGQNIPLRLSDHR